MVPSKRDEVHGAQAADMTSRKKSTAVNCRAGGVHYVKKRVEKSCEASLRVNRIPRQGVEDPLVWGHRNY